MDIVRSLLGIRRIFPVNCELLVTSILGRGRRAFPVPSTPSRLYVSTSSSAVRAKVSLVTGSLATAAKADPPWPPPPIERMSFRCWWSRLSFANELRHPWLPSTSISKSAYSSLSFGQDQQQFKVQLFLSKLTNTLPSALTLNKYQQSAHRKLRQRSLTGRTMQRRSRHAKHSQASGTKVVVACTPANSDSKLH